MALQDDPTPGAFPLTQWSLVERAAESNTAIQRPALAGIVAQYVPALRAYLLRSNRISPDRADDLLQGFLADKIVEQGLLQRARREKGRLRSLLMTSLDRYVVSRHRIDSAAKRSPSEGVVSLAEDSGSLTSTGVDFADPFNVEWARQLLSMVIARTRSECETSGRVDLWRIFEMRVLRPALEGTEPKQYQELVDELGLATPLQACSLLTTAKRMFVRNLRSVAADYATNEADSVDAEIDDLRQILSRHGAQFRTRPRK